MIKVLVLVGSVAIDESSEHNANKIEIIIELSEECISFSSIHPCKASIKSWWRMISNWGLESRGNWFIITITQLPQEIREGSNSNEKSGKINFWLSWEPQIYWNLCQYNLAQFVRSGCIPRFQDLLNWSKRSKIELIIPVVHEDVWRPDCGGREAQILDISILWLIPPEIVIYPLLKAIIRVMIHSLRSPYRL